jgi:sugar phosphate isomerase/epimerase
MDWRAFLETLMQLGFNGPFVIENEGANSAHTGNLGATVQGFRTAVLCLAPIVWPLRQNGYEFDRTTLAPLKPAASKDIPVTTMKDLGVGA